MNRYRHGRPKTDRDSALSHYPLIFSIKIFFADFEKQLPISDIKSNYESKGIKIIQKQSFDLQNNFDGNRTLIT